MNTTRFPRPSRRAVLRTAAVSFATPIFESLAPRAAAAAASPLRFFYFYVPNGFNMNGWTPKTRGEAWELTPTLAPLAKVRDQVTVITGLENEPASHEPQGDHAHGTAGFLTCKGPPKDRKNQLDLGVSVDQLIAAKVAAGTSFPSLQLGVGARRGPDCDNGYACPYQEDISWKDAKTPLAKLSSPRAVFDRLFANAANPGASAAERERRRVYRKSVIDQVLRDVKRLDARLGATDHAKLDEYVTGVRELERRVNAVDPGTAPAMCAGGTPPADKQPFATNVQLMLDLSVLAFRCDLTRVISFMANESQTDANFDFLGVSGGHHAISHHGNGAENLRKLLVIDKWEVTQLAAFLEKLAAIDEGGRSLLYNSVVLFSSEISDGDRHNHDNLPMLVAGSGGGAIKPGLHRAPPAKTPLANLFLAMLKMAGRDDKAFSNSTGALDLG